MNSQVVFDLFDGFVHRLADKDVVGSKILEEPYRNFILVQQDYFFSRFQSKGHFRRCASGHTKHHYQMA